MRIVTLFPNLINSQLYKGLGKDVELLSKNYGYSCTIVHYFNENIHYFNEEKSLLESNIIKKIFGMKIDGAIWIIRNLARRDILRLYNLTSTTVFWIIVTKFIKGNSKIWIVMDYGTPIIKFKPIRRFFYMNIIKFAKLATIESTEAMKWLNFKYGLKTLYHPHCVVDYKLTSIDFDRKENIILSVGRIGDFAKNNELLINSFIQIYDKLSEWILIMVGPYDESFKIYIDKIYESNPKIPIIFTGELSKLELDKIYRRAKIFCLTSRSEGFPNVIVEAASAGCFIISSRIASIVDFTKNSTYGGLFNVQNESELIELLIDKCSSSGLTEETINAYNWYIENYNCKDVIKKLNMKLVSYFNEGI